jgi:hypothetical protein
MAENSVEPSNARLSTDAGTGQQPGSPKGHARRPPLFNHAESFVFWGKPGLTRFCNASLTRPLGVTQACGAWKQAMAPQALSRTTASEASRDAMSRVQRLSLAAAVIAIVNKATLPQALASAAVAIAVPAAATAFVYEVTALRGAQLTLEENDRVEFLRIAAETVPAPSPGARPIAVAAAERPDIGHKLDAMIASRAKMLDIFGDDARTVAPIYVRIIRQMLSDDNATFASLSAYREDGDAAALAAKEASLRAVHARLTRLVGA